MDGSLAGLVAVAYPSRVGLRAHARARTLGGVATERARTRCRERLERLAESNEGSESMRREAIAELRLAIGFERWCVPLVDPDTLISHTGVADTDHVLELPRLQVHDASPS